MSEVDPKKWVYENYNPFEKCTDISRGIVTFL
jgi:hypothetical protein